MPSNRAQQLTAWLCTVDLAVLAARLSRESGKLYDEMGAARWLTCCMRTKAVPGIKSMRASEPSPFAQTDEWSQFYCECDPADLLNLDEITHVCRCRKRNRTGDGLLLGKP